MLNASDMYFWSVSNTIPLITTVTAQKTFKTQGFGLLVKKVVGNIYNADGAVLETEKVRDRITTQMYWEDTGANLCSEPIDFFNLIDTWNQYAAVQDVILQTDVNVTVTFAVDTSTALFVAGDYPLRLQLTFFGTKVLKNGQSGSL